jgi:hypothetical protein
LGGDSHDPQNNGLSALTLFRRIFLPCFDVISTHAKKIDVKVNETRRIITGCLKPTYTKILSSLGDISTPEIRRKLIAEEERKKEM